MRTILSLILCIGTLTAFADAPYPNKLQLSGSPVGGVDVEASEIVGRASTGDTRSLSIAEVWTILSEIPVANIADSSITDAKLYTETVATGSIADAAVTDAKLGGGTLHVESFTIASGAAAAQYWTPVVAVTVIDVWGYTSGVAGASDTVSVATSGGAATAITWSETSTISRATSLANTAVAANTPVTITSVDDGTDSSISAGVVYVLFRKDD